MSMTSINLMRQAHREEEKAMDEMCAERLKIRTSITPDVRDKADALFSRVHWAVRSRYRKGQANFKVNIDLKVHPNDVVDEVVRRFKAKGWKARHVFNDGEPTYDYLELTPTVNDFLKNL